MRNLKGQVALVTGAGRGIGKSIALHLAELGASVVVHYGSSQKGANEIVDQIRSLPGAGQAVALKADISSVQDIRMLADETIRQFGQIDILVNNAAIDPTIDIFEVTEAFWDKVVNTNMKGAFFCAQLCAQDMAKRKRGKIINISSVHGMLTMPEYAVYAATKGGINAMTRQLALDLAKYQIQVNAIAPGATEVEKFSEQPTFDRDAIGRQIPLGRIGRPLDVARTVAFLASEDADFITGQVLTVDGGSSTRFYL